MQLQRENEDLRKKVLKRKKTESSSSSSSSSTSSDSESEDNSSTTGPPEVLLDGNLPYKKKKAFITEAIPFNTNSEFVAVIKDKEGERILRHILQREMEKAISEEEGTFDTAMKSRVLAHKVLRTLFSNEFYYRFKFFDPRPDYNQKAGTAMTQEPSEWMRDVVSDAALLHFNTKGQSNRFTWAEFLLKLREIWRWNRRNVTKARNKASKDKMKKKKAAKAAEEKSKRKRETKPRAAPEKKEKAKGAGKKKRPKKE